MEEYKAAGKHVVYLDLGYWGRRHGGRFDGFHKVAVNDRHPTEYIMDRGWPGNRLSVWGLRPKPWKTKGNHILLAGMSDRAAKVAGFAPCEFERWAVSEIRKRTARPIIYRPKPSWKGAGGLQDTHFSPPSEALSSVLTGAWAVVTHHSNVAIDGLVEGIPAFCWDGAAKHFARQNLEAIEDPIYPDGRQQFLNNLAYSQFCVSEIECGMMWRHLKDAELIPCG